MGNNIIYYNMSRSVDLTADVKKETKNNDENGRLNLSRSEIQKYLQSPETL